MAYQSIHSGPAVDAAVSLLENIQTIHDDVNASKQTVLDKADEVDTALTDAENAAVLAGQHKDDAQTAAGQAQGSATAAATSASQAAASASSAATDRQTVQDAVADALEFRNEAVEAAGTATEATDTVVNVAEQFTDDVRYIKNALAIMKYGDGPYPVMDVTFLGPLP